MTDPMRIDIVSDVVCPWCVIGYRQLCQALDQVGIEADMHWHPFELNPDMPPEGQNLRAHIAEKYGASRADSDAARAGLGAMGAELGFVFNYTDESRMVNTFRAHQLIHWARDQGKGAAVKEALFAAYFTDQRDVHDLEVLADIAEAEGLDRDAALLSVSLGTHADEVRAHEQFWIRQGVQGVPAMVFDSQYLVTGAQGIETYARILRQVADARAA